MSNGDFQPGFDPGFFIGGQPELTPDLRAASDALIQLQEKAANTVRKPLIEAGNLWKDFAEKAENQVVQPLLTVDKIADQLRNKVEQQLANEFAAARENVSALLGEQFNPNIVNIGMPPPNPGEGWGDAPPPALAPPPIIPPKPGVDFMPPPFIPGVPPAAGGLGVPLPPAAPPVIPGAIPPGAAIAPPIAPPVAPIPPVAPPALPPANQPPIGPANQQPQQPPNQPPPLAGNAPNQDGPEFYHPTEPFCYNGRYGRSWISDKDPNRRTFQDLPLPSGVKCVPGNATPQSTESDKPASGDCVPRPTGRAGMGVTDPTNPASILDVPAIDPLTGKPYCDAAPQPPANSGTVGGGTCQTSPPPQPLNPLSFAQACPGLTVPLSTSNTSEHLQFGASVLLPLIQNLHATFTAETSNINIGNKDDTPLSSVDPFQIAARMVTTGLLGSIKGVGESLFVVGESSVKMIDMLGAALSPLGGCLSPETTAATGLLMGVGLLDKYIGGPLDYLATPVVYKLQGNCPVYYPSIDNAKAAYLGNSIDIDVLKNWVAINGHCWEPFSKVLDVEMSKPIPDQLLQMNRRGIIKDSEYDEGMRRLGYIDPKHIERIKQIGEYAPPPQDIVRFMVRDADDKDLVEAFDLDCHFTDKYQDQLKEWAKWSGVSDQYMKYLWRAHWDIPSPTQLFEMYHRLSRLPESDPNHVSIENVKRALEQADIAPYWIDKYLAISHSPMTRVDTRRAYNIGVMTREDVKSTYQDLGYNEKNAETLTKFTEKEKIKAGYNHPSVARYLRGHATKLEMQIELAESGYEAEQITKISERAIKLFRWKHAGACVKALRKRFMIGEFDNDKARGILISYGLDGEQADIIIDGWGCERAAKGKEFTASLLVKLLDDALIQPNEFVQRLTRLGYREDDAIKILTMYQIKQQRIQQKLGEQQQKQLEAQLAKQARDLQKQAAKAERDNANAAKQQAARQAAENRRESALVKAARDYSLQEGIEIDIALAKIKDCYKLVRKEYGLSVDQSIQAVVIGVEKRPKDDTLDVCERIKMVADGLVMADLEAG